MSLVPHLHSIKNSTKTKPPTPPKPSKLNSGSAIKLRREGDEIKISTASITSNFKESSNSETISESVCYKNVSKMITVHQEAIVESKKSVTSISNISVRAASSTPKTPFTLKIPPTKPPLLPKPRIIPSTMKSPSLDSSCKIRRDPSDTLYEVDVNVKEPLLEISGIEEYVEGVLETDIKESDDSDRKEKAESNAGDDAISVSSYDSYSVKQRLRNFFGSFGKGKKMIPFGHKHDDWETLSISSNEDHEDTNVGNNGEEATFVEKDEPSAPLSPAEEKARKIRYIVEELISSEAVFVDVLKLLVVDFQNYLNEAGSVENGGSSSGAISEGDMTRIMDSLPQLLCFHEDMLKDLQTRFQGWDEWPKIADIIVKKGPFLKMYSTYVQNFKDNSFFLDECCNKSPRFAASVKEFEATERCKKLTIQHYLLKPVQRLPQYRLLLQNYLDSLNESCLDYNDAKNALKIVCEATEHANKSMQDGLHFTKLLELQSKLGNYAIIKPGRELVKEGELYKLCRKDMQLRYFILLNDCLLYTSYYGSSYYGSSLKVNCELPLGGMKVYIPQVEDYHNEFNIISIARSFTLMASTQESRQEWVTILENTIEEFNKRQLSFSTKFAPKSLWDEPLKIGKEAPIWIPDHRVTMCQSCTSEFTLTFRRHHCRACGKVVCSMCSDNKAPLQYNNFQANRVCDECFAHLFAEFNDCEKKMFDRIKDRLNLEDEKADVVYKNIQACFKKHDMNSGKKTRHKFVPSRLKEVTANDSGSRMSGWLHKKTGRSWKRFWFVLKEQVLYIYKASEDVMALTTIPVLGYTIEAFKQVGDAYEDIDSKFVFQLTHAGQPPLVFRTDKEHMADKWVAALEEAANLK